MLPDKARCMLCSAWFENPALYLFEHILSASEAMDCITTVCPSCLPEAIANPQVVNLILYSKMRAMEIDDE